MASPGTIKSLSQPDDRAAFHITSMYEDTGQEAKQDFHLMMLILT
ncbi:hypothetical protein RvY_02587, partial [Ramazzottius varieornatus]